MKTLEITADQAYLPESQEFQAVPEHVSYGGKLAIEALQAKFDAITEIAEGVNGQMRSTIKLTQASFDFYGPDERSMKQTADTGIETAVAEAEANPNLAFEPPRRQIEREEIDVVEEAFRTGKANTVSVQSDLPHALEDATHDVGGYNVRRKLAIHRVWMKDSHGEIFLVSQTLDGSNRHALEAVRSYLGFETQSGELLGQRCLMNLSDEEQETFLNRTTTVYDQDLEEQFGEKYYAGRRPIDYRNTLEFAKQQQDLIELYTEAKLSHSLDRVFMYDLLATANARFTKWQLRQGPQSSTSVLSAAGVETGFNMTSYSRAAVRWEMQNAGRTARLKGETFSACGSTYTSTGEDGTVEASFGNSGESKHWSGGKIYKNTKCESCHQVKKEVGACKICEDCVKNPKKHSRSGSTTTPKPTTYTMQPVKNNHQRQYDEVKHSTTKGKVTHSFW